MYAVNDYVVYERTGICKIVDTCTKKVKGVDKIYYILKPVYKDKELTIYSDVDKAKNFMRKPISKLEAMNLIESIPKVEKIWFDNCRIRQEKYKEIIKEGNLNELIGVLKGIYKYKTEKEHNNKKLSTMDKHNFDYAEKMLYQEFALALDMEVDNVNNYIESILSNEE